MLGMETANSQLKGENGGSLNNEKQMKLQHSLTPSQKRNSKSMEELEAGKITLTALEENMGRTHCDRNGSKLFLDPLLE